MKSLATLLLAAFAVLTIAACAGPGHGPSDDVYARWYSGSYRGGGGGGSR